MSEEQEILRLRMPLLRFGASDSISTRESKQKGMLSCVNSEKRVDPESCTFEMTAIGPIFEEQETMPDHKPLRDKTAALESALAEELTRRGYKVLGTHPRAVQADPILLEHLISQLHSIFPEKQAISTSHPSFQPIKLRYDGLKLRGDGPTASEIIVRERRESRF